MRMSGSEIWCDGIKDGVVAPEPGLAIREHNWRPAAEGYTTPPLRKTRAV